jgi:hypothetical protein
LNTAAPCPKYQAAEICQALRFFHGIPPVKPGPSSRQARKQHPIGQLIFLERNKTVRACSRGQITSLFPLPWKGLYQPKNGDSNTSFSYTI